MIWLVLLALFLTGLGVLVWYVVAAPGSQVLGRSLVCGPPDSDKIALTFDDGPGEATPVVLDMLKQADIRATFFLCGQNVERYPEIARRIAQEGHEIGNHTYTHPRLLGRTPGKIAYEIERAQNIIAHHTGRRPALFRPPFGLRWFGLFRILERNSLASVMWSVNSFDWKLPVEQIVERVLNGIGPGAIVLFHDGVPPSWSQSRDPSTALPSAKLRTGRAGRERPVVFLFRVRKRAASREATVEALRAVLHAISGRYRCVPVSEL
ncbi:MAG: polysaccharide deacetylase family protein [Terriglobia bacterium]